MIRACRCSRLNHLQHHHETRLAPWTTAPAVALLPCCLLVEAGDVTQALHQQHVRSRELVVAVGGLRVLATDIWVIPQLLQGVAILDCKAALARLT
jgi:hypothetical protein